MLWLLCILGALSVFPYVLSVNHLPDERSLGAVIFVSVLQAALFFGLICWASFKILPKTDLRPFLIENPRQQIVYPAVISGILVGLVLFLADKFLFDSSISGMHPPLWAGAVASIYGAVNEQVLLRLFLFTLLYFLFMKMFRKSPTKRLAILWSVNVLVALIFGIGHLPLAFKLGASSASEISRIVFLNGIAGVVFGWLYWSRGIWTAMAAHFIADLMVHVFFV